MKNPYFCKQLHPKVIYLLFFLSPFYEKSLRAQEKTKDTTNNVKEKRATLKKPKVYYGTASYYADKFNGRQTASGENYSHSKPTAACNVLPMGTWIRVTNLKNNISVIVRVNDRLHPKVKRLVDLNRDSAEKLGYVRKGLEEVKVEVLEVEKVTNSKIK